jgi:hypothetical protein
MAGPRSTPEAASKAISWSPSSMAVTTSRPIAATYTGLCISNPVTSTKNAVLLQASVMQSVIQATQPEAFAIATGFNATTNVTHTAAVAVHNGFLSGNVGSVVADTSSTLPTAPFYTIFGGQTASATSQASTIIMDLGGSLILPPGGYALWVTPGQASVAGMWFSFSWEEVPV